MLDLSKAYNKALEEEKTMTGEQKALKNVGKLVQLLSLSPSLPPSLSLSNAHTHTEIFTHTHTLQDPKRHLEEKVESVLTANITQSLGAMLDTVVFS